MSSKSIMSFWEDSSPFLSIFRFLVGPFVAYMLANATSSCIMIFQSCPRYCVFALFLYFCICFQVSLSHLLLSCTTVLF
uniref:Uncharacterized protein n=1 Tax=Rhizophora mucronata TaxID=61149 RepID=A0A2P2N9V8_RHIMU